jgi:hypothetical protein
MGKGKGKGEPAGCMTNICFNCANACGDLSCPWITRQQPVEGWKAEPRLIEYTNGSRGKPARLLTYRIISCPFFEKGRRKRNKRRASLYSWFPKISRSGYCRKSFFVICKI